MISIELQSPWNNNKFEINNLSKITYLVGPNGSGKTRFSEQISKQLNNCRTLSADRIANFNNKHTTYVTALGNPQFQEGFSKKTFKDYKADSKRLASGFDTFVLLEEKLDLRINVESTLSQLLNREIKLEWDSGNLIPKAYNRISKNTYDLHKSECHGIKELLVILTHLYNDENESLIIDEPELNLHPQYQSFLISEIKRVVNNNLYNKKNIILITHSPFILDIKTIEDLKSIISFSSHFSTPRYISEISEMEEKELLILINNLNVHHKQLFFSDSPIFVEGIYDSLFLNSLQNLRNKTFEGAGSCIIDVGGNDKISLYFLLCESLNKKAFYIYDLDSLFTQKLRKTASSSSLTNKYLISIGAGTNFQDICSQLEKTLKNILDEILKLELKTTSLSYDFVEFIKQENNKSDKDKLKRIRTAIIIEIQDNDNLKDFVDEDLINLAKSQLINIINSLRENNVYLLKKGAIENYFPSFTGVKYRISENLKRTAISDELEIINNISKEEIEDRHREIIEILDELPAIKPIDYKNTITSYLSDFVFKVQQGFNKSNINSIETIKTYLANDWKPYETIMLLESFEIVKNDFKCALTILDKWQIGVIQFEFTSNDNPTKIEI